jgi:hypothetical protein
MALNKVTNDDSTVSVLNCVDENISEVESNNSDNETCDNQESHHRSSISDSEQNGGKAVPAVRNLKVVRNKLQ